MSSNTLVSNPYSDAFCSAKVAPVVSVCTATVFPRRSSSPLMPEPVFTMSARVDSKYGSAKVVDFLRASVIEMAAAPASHLPAAKAAPDQTWSNAMSTISWVRPRSSATRSMRSTSKPTMAPVSSLNWNGLKARCVQTVSLPPAMNVGSFELPV